MKFVYTLFPQSNHRNPRNDKKSIRKFALFSACFTSSYQRQLLPRFHLFFVRHFFLFAIFFLRRLSINSVPPISQASPTSCGCTPIRGRTPASPGDRPPAPKAAAGPATGDPYAVVRSPFPSRGSPAAGKAAHGGGGGKLMANCGEQYE